MADDDATVFVEGLYGKSLGAARDGVGVIEMKRPATEQHLKLARKYLLEIDERDLDVHEDWLVDRGSGRLYDVLPNDPLMTDPIGGDCDAFTAMNGVVLFLRRASAGTIEQLEQARAEQQRLAAKKSDDERRFRSRQKQHVLRVGDLPGQEGTPTLRAAAQTIEELGGKIARDDLGQLVCSIPEKLSPDTEPGFTGMLEREQIQRAARAAQILAHGSAVVFAALEHASKGQPLSSLLPEETALV
jgi:hypothetical protein